MIVAALCLLLVQAYAGPAPGGTTGAAASEATPEFEIPPGLETGWYTRIQTSMGEIFARLLPEQAPQAVAHFVGMSQGTLPWTDMVSGDTIKDRYYDGMRIQTVQAGRLFETGDATEQGRSTPLLYLPYEGYGPLDFSRPYMMGYTLLGGARISAVKFFVTASGQPWLNGDNPCFGQVVAGQNVVFNISQVKAYSSRSPIEDIFIERVDVFRVGDPPPLPEPVPFKPKKKHVSFRNGPPVTTH